MRILINDGEKQRKILLPTGFLLDFLIPKAVCRRVDGKKAKITKKTLKSVKKCLKKYKKENGALTLVEVYENDKQAVKIIL